MPSLINIAPLETRIRSVGKTQLFTLANGTVEQIELQNIVYISGMIVTDSETIADTTKRIYNILLQIGHVALTVFVRHVHRLVNDIDSRQAAARIAFSDHITAAAVAQKMRHLNVASKVGVCSPRAVADLILENLRESVIPRLLIGHADWSNVPSGANIDLDLQLFTDGVGPVTYVFTFVSSGNYVFTIIH